MLMRRGEIEAGGASLQDLIHCERAIFCHCKSCLAPFPVAVHTILGFIGRKFGFFANFLLSLSLHICLSVSPSIPPFFPLPHHVCLCLYVYLSVCLSLRPSPSSSPPPCVYVCVLPSLQCKTIISVHMLTHHFSVFSCTCIILFQTATRNYL